MAAHVSLSSKVHYGETWTLVNLKNFKVTQTHGSCFLLISVFGMLGFDSSFVHRLRKAEIDW